LKYGTKARVTLDMPMQEHRGDERIGATYSQPSTRRK